MLNLFFVVGLEMGLRMDIFKKKLLGAIKICQIEFVGFIDDVVNCKLLNYLCCYGAQPKLLLLWHAL
jgi:hypothetical protein